MEKEQIVAIFDQQAASYDQQWSKMSPINGALHLLTSAVLADLPPTAWILCVGAGTGAEILQLAETFPGWHFTAVEPSTAMLDVCRERAEKQGISSRCVFHAGYLDSLPQGTGFDAATSFLVSQFILDPESRSAFFKGIADRLRPEGILVSSDLAGDLNATDYRDLLEVWVQVMKGGGLPPEGIERIREAYRRDVAVIPPKDVREIISIGGFESPVRFFQAGLIHAWYARRSSGR
jgi:tRNA (cmo5U34)-methyltransferase